MRKIQQTSTSAQTQSHFYRCIFLVVEKAVFLKYLKGKNRTEITI